MLNVSAPANPAHRWQTVKIVIRPTCQIDGKAEYCDSSTSKL